MIKVLVALRFTDDVEAMRLGANVARERDATMAVCQIRPAEADVRSDLALQKRITMMLRAALGPFAEDVAVFIIGERSGDDLASIAATWDADVLVRDGNLEAIT